MYFFLRQSLTTLCRPVSNSLVAQAGLELAMIFLRQSPKSPKSCSLSNVTPKHLSEDLAAPSIICTWKLKVFPFLLRPTEIVSVLLKVTAAGHGQLVTAFLCVALRVKFD